MEENIQTPTQSIQPIEQPQPVQQPKSNSYLLAIFSVLLLIMLFLTAFFYYQNQQLKDLLASYQTLATYPTPTVTTDLTADWKTYENNKTGVSFKYPPTITLKESSTSVMFTDFNGDFQTTITWNFNKLTAPLDQELKTRDSCPPDITNGLVRGPIPNSFRCDFVSSHYSSVDIWFANGNSMYKADVSAINPNVPIPTEKIDLLNQILSTIKFEN